MPRFKFSARADFARSLWPCDQDSLPPPGADPPPVADPPPAAEAGLCALALGCRIRYKESSGCKSRASHAAGDERGCRGCTPLRVGVELLGQRGSEGGYSLRGGAMDPVIDPPICRRGGGKESRAV